MRAAIIPENHWTYEYVATTIRNGKNHPSQASQHPLTLETFHCLYLRNHSAPIEHQLFFSRMKMTHIDPFSLSKLLLSPFHRPCSISQHSAFAMLPDAISTKGDLKCLNCLGGQRQSVQSLHFSISAPSRHRLWSVSRRLIDFS